MIIIDLYYLVTFLTYIVFMIVHDGLNIIGPPGVPGIRIPCTPIDGAPLRYGSQIVVLIKCSSSSAYM